MKVCVVQIDAGLTGVENRFLRLKEHATQAAQDGADLVVFPELYLSGYNVGENLHHFAEAQDGPFAGRVASLAKQTGLAIAYGYPERDGDRVYNAFIFIDDHGKTLANHRKTVLPIGIEHDWFATGSGFSLLRFKDAVIALVICYECEFPEIVRSLALDGAQIVLIATAGGKDWEQVATRVVASRAYENGIFVAYANYCGAENGHGFCGMSCMIDPLGDDLARAGKTEARLCATFDLGAIAEARSKVPFLKDREAVVHRLHRTEGR